MEELNNNQKGRLADFYINRSVFVTGASGFMGKVLVEKLLYSCSNVKNVFILLRPKRGKSSDSRLEEMFKLSMFKRLRDEKPHVLKKVILVEGDITTEELGLKEELKKRLINEVSVLFHCAATLKLESNLKDAVEMNTWGTWRVLQLAKEMKKLEVFVHLSTAFCHVDHAILEEKAYDFGFNPKDIMNLVRFMDNSLLDKITFDMIAPHPNTYTFTKRLAERLVTDEFPNLPVCIARPSIVCPAFREPIPGWVDNLNGPVGIMVAAGKGVLRSMYCKSEYNAELIPVDFAINGLLAIARKIGTEKKSKEIQVFNMTQSEEKAITWGKILQLGKKFAFEVPFDIVLWFPDGNIRRSLWVHKIYAFFLHWLPAYFIDFLLLIFCQKRFMIRVQQKIAVGLEVLQYFTTHQWTFRNEKFLDVRDSMCSEDKEEFNIDFKSVDDIPYLKDCLMGAREYCLKEPRENLPRAKKMIKILYVVDRIVRFLFILFMAHLIISWARTATYVLDATGENLKNVPFVRSFVRHADVPMQRDIKSDCRSEPRAVTLGSFVTTAGLWYQINALRKLLLSELKFIKNVDVIAGREILCNFLIFLVLCFANTIDD